MKKIHNPLPPAAKKPAPPPSTPAMNARTGTFTREDHDRFEAQGFRSVTAEYHRDALRRWKIEQRRRVIVEETLRDLVDIRRGTGPERWAELAEKYLDHDAATVAEIERVAFQVARSLLSGSTPT